MLKVLLRLWWISRKGGRIKTDSLDWLFLRHVVLCRDFFTCRHCGFCPRNRGNVSHNLHVHHRREVSRGGSNQLGNLVTLCTACHKVIHPWIEGKS